MIHGCFNQLSITVNKQADQSCLCAKTAKEYRPVFCIFSKILCFKIRSTDHYCKARDVIQIFNQFSFFLSHFSLFKEGR